MPARRLVVRRNPRNVRGLGQAPTSPIGLPSCSNVVGSSIPQAVLITGGGLATLVGVIGAIASDDYRQDFAIAAGVGLLSSFIGGVWAASSIAQCTFDQFNASAALPAPSSPTPSPAAPVAQPIYATAQ
jgi:hypothetical protein